MSAPLHRVWRLGADVDTDALAPGHAMKHGMDVIARHCLESLRPDFAQMLPFPSMSKRFSLLWKKPRMRSPHTIASE